MTTRSQVRVRGSNCVSWLRTRGMTRPLRPVFFFSLSERAEQQEMADPQQDFSSPPQPCPQPCSSPQRMQSCKLKGPLPVNRRVHREVGCSLQTSGRKEKKREKKTVIRMESKKRERPCCRLQANNQSC